MIESKIFFTAKGFLFWTFFSAVLVGEHVWVVCNLGTVVGRINEFENMWPRGF